MMMGFGSYGSGGGCSSSSSNLSALAPPFTVDRYVSKPLVDLTEPPLNWLNTHSVSFDSFHSPNSYVYPFNSSPLPPPPSAARMSPPDNSVPFTSTDSLLYGQNADAMLTSNLVEAKPYYASYVSPTKYSYEDYAQSLSGLWDVARGWDYGKNVELADSFSSKEMNATGLSIYKDYTDQGAHSSKVLSACEQNSTSIDKLGSEMHLGSANREQLNYTSFPGQIAEFLPVEHSRKSVLGSTSLFSETYSVASSCEQGPSRSHQTPYDALYEKSVKQHGIISNDMSSVMKSSPGLVIRSQAVGSSPLAPIANSFNNVENGSGPNKTAFSGIDNCSNTKDFHPLQSSEHKVHFNSSQVSSHLEGDNHSFPNRPKKEKLLRNVSNDPFKAKSGLQIPDTGPGGFNLTLGDGAINHVEGSSESLDYNPAVDSPCWKVAPIYHFSPLETSGPVSTQLAKKIEVCKGSDPIGSTNNASKSSPEKPSESSVYHENGCPEKSSSSPKRPYLANWLIQEHGFDHAAKAGSDYMISSCGLGIWFPDYIDKPKRDYVLANNSLDEFNFKAFQSIQQNPVEDNLTSENKSQSGTVVAGVEISTNNAIENCSSHVPLHATEHVFGSPSSTEAAAVKLNKLTVEESAPKMCVQTLISTIHNLSELLLFHCLNQVELKENDLETLKGVVNNLGKCVSKTLRPEAPSEESPPLIKFSQFPKELSDIREGVPASSSQAKKAAVSFLIQSDYHHDQEGRIRSILSAKKSEQCSDFTSQRGDPERIKVDNMTRAIKKVLSENFVVEEDEQTQMLLYRNLWLEAEAALCCSNYKARFDRMKIELEKCKLHIKDLSANTPELDKLLQFTFFPDLNTSSMLPPLVKNDSAQDASVPDFPIVNASSQPDDVMARFHFQKLQEDRANHMNTTDVEKVSGSNFSCSSNMNMVDKMAAEVKNDDTPDISKSSLPNSISTSHADDVEASVMARFHILKSRIENSSCADVDGQLLLQVADFGFAGEEKHRPEDGILDINMEPVLQHNIDNHPLDKLTVKEFHQHVKDDLISESHRTNRLECPLPSSCYDSSSSDWEHVLKEDLPGQNC